MGLIEDLKGGPVALDTQVFIYFIEEDEHFLALVKLYSKVLIMAPSLRQHPVSL